LSSFFRAWYLFLGLGLLTFVFTALVGRVPFQLSSWVGLPHNLIYRVGLNIRATASDLTDRSELRQEITRLELEVASLRQENRQLLLRLERLSEVLEVREVQSPGVVTTAPVTGGSSGSVLERLVIGMGKRHGVLPNMPVTVPQGLVGIVTEVSATRSSVRIVTDPQSRVGVTVRGRGGQGIAIGEVGGRLRVTRFIEQSPVEVGDLVETSSYGGLFPRGVLVGVVEEVLPVDPNELRSSFIVRPAVDLSTLLEVALITPQ
jgi:rod shape-determining protein MreC